MKISLCAFTLIFVVVSKGAVAKQNIFEIKELDKNNISKIQKSKSIVSFSDNEQVVILDNPRYVIKGELYDMWAKKTIKSKSELLASVEHYPFSILKIDTTTLFGVKVKGNLNSLTEYTLFFNPFDKKNTDFIKENEKLLSKKNIRIVYSIPSKQYGLTKELVQKFYGLSCENYKINVLLDLVKIKSISLDSPCDETIYKTAGLLNFMNINNPPMLISNKTEYLFNQSNNLAEWLIKN